MYECTVTTLNERLRTEDPQLIDVRESAEFLASRIAGAKSLPLSELETRVSELDRTKPVYLICRTGRRSAEAQKKLTALGFIVFNITDGFEAWKRAGLPFLQDSKAPWSLERQVRMAAGSLVILGVLLAALVHPYLILLSAFVGAGLMFAAATDTCAMGMLLAKMPWNQPAARLCECGYASVGTASSGDRSNASRTSATKAQEVASR